MKLTMTRIDDLKCEPGQKDRLVFDDAQKGLAVRVTASGSKSYLAQYTFAGQRRRVPLGSCGAVSLADARDAAKAIMGDVAKGLDPAAERKEIAYTARAQAAKERTTLSVLVDTWKTLHLVQKRPRYASEAIRALNVAFARQWDRPAEDLDRATVVRVLDGLTRAGSIAMASRTAAYGRACFQWALKRGTVAANPFAALPPMGAVPTRDRVLTDDECTAVWRVAMSMPAPFGPLVRFLMLTGQRREEVAGMTWDELANDRTEWTIPGPRTKNGTPHIVPLSDAARDILGLLPHRKDAEGKEIPFVFAGEAGPFNSWSKAKIRLDKLITEARRKAPTEAGESPDDVSSLPAWRIHDLRRTLATGLQRLGVRLEVTEAVLNHVSGSRSGIVGVYQRHSWADEKRAALDGWAEHVMALVEGRTATGNVVILTKRA